MRNAFVRPMNWLFEALLFQLQILLRVFFVEPRLFVGQVDGAALDIGTQYLRACVEWTPAGDD